MTDLTAQIARLPRPGKAWIASLVLLLIVGLLDPANLWPTVEFAAGAIWHTLPFILFAVLEVA